MPNKALTSSTLAIPEVGVVPSHIAIVMDGNGRWARQRLLPRVAGHRKGVEAVRRTVEACMAMGVQSLTLFAFSSENWRRPSDEVSVLMKLFLKALKTDVRKMAKEGIRLRIVGDTSAFNEELRHAIAESENLTLSNTRFNLNIAANYGGRWDILNATRLMLKANPLLANQPETIREEHLAPYLALADQPEPDLYIRTGGEQRVSNFLLWQLAYTEFYFTERFWPEFGKEMLLEAVRSYNQRERRFGRTSEQLHQASRASAS
ncbi:MAG: di-trans,poly-cis-decaprenylcistransferase [Limnobacter sp.]|nr:di-trans,poly-cis-decaprenylcistransferase [Limnobacter sp.]